MVSPIIGSAGNMRCRMLGREATQVKAGLGYRGTRGFCYTPSAFRVVPYTHGINVLGTGGGASDVKTVRRAVHGRPQDQKDSCMTSPHDAEIAMDAIVTGKSIVAGPPLRFL